MLKGMEKSIRIRIRRTGNQYHCISESETSSSDDESSDSTFSVRESETSSSDDESSDNTFSVPSYSGDDDESSSDDNEDYTSSADAHPPWYNKKARRSKARKVIITYILNISIILYIVRSYIELFVIILTVIILILMCILFHK